MTHNPYSPPSAPVADAEAAPIAMPWQINVSTWLIGISLVLGIVGFGMEPASLGFDAADDGALIVIMLTMVVAILGAVVLLAICIRRAHRWARIVYSALVLLNLISAYEDVPESFASSWYFGVLYLVAALLDLATVVLLFTPAANAWFRQWRAARRP